MQLVTSIRGLLIFYPIGNAGLKLLRLQLLILLIIVETFLPLNDCLKISYPALKDILPFRPFFL
jgi:hypothetical protein